ncbi:hypothetical protein KAR91_08250, partial [Candidatus Pacearchaeota archaeon]|nr:hypothetical protein [Candidatus Pacearchaeota archaeon]
MSKKRIAFEYLKIVRKATSLQIREVVNTVAPAAMMGDLRKRGCNIASKLLYTTKEGVQIWEYEILSWPV